MQPEKLKKSIAFLDDNPSVDLLFTNFQSIDEKSAILNPNYLHEYETLSAFYLHETLYITYQAWRAIHTTPKS